MSERQYETVDIVIMNADGDINLTVNDCMLDEALGDAEQLVDETLEEHAEANNRYSGRDFPAFGAKVAAYDDDSAVVWVYAGQDDFYFNEDGILCVDWKYKDTDELVES